MKKIVNYVIGLSIVLFMTGCSHKITIDPSLDKIRLTEVEEKLNVNVGYFISQSDKSKKVNTPGGGGDSVDYTPYKDVEGALNLVLSKVFNRVYSLQSPTDIDYIKHKDIKYVFIPQVFTDSYSDSAFTWPPTKFIFKLNCQATDINGDIVWQEVIHSEGFATFDEFKDNFSLSAQRATEKAFFTLLLKLKNAKEFKGE